MAWGSDCTVHPLRVPFTAIDCSYNNYIQILCSRDKEQQFAPVCSCTCKTATLNNRTLWEL